MERKIDHFLLEWKNNKERKALLIRGARQVGKTYSIRQLGKSFKHYLEVNFEEEKTVKQFFSGSLNPSMLSQKLSAYFAIPIIAEETLLFFDEIQACPEALSSLRFFYEKMPNLHIIAAGSLLELTLSDIPSHGVGRIHSLFMSPMSFDEFLKAAGEDMLIEIKNNANSNHPIDEVLHQKLIEYLKIFYLVGGMPEVVKEYIYTKNILSCQKKLDDLIETLRDDFAKYKKRSPVQRLKEVFESIVFQTGSKFKYVNIESGSAHNALREALNLIVQAGLAYKIYHTSAQGIPLGAQIKPNRFKVILLDTGIHQRILGLSMADIITAKNVDIINKGHIAELFAGTEIVKHSAPITKPQLYYWQKEKRGSSAEVDYLLQKGTTIFPIEVKSGTRGKMQSIKLFMAEHNIPYGIRISLENFACSKNIYVYPLYAINNILQGHIPSE